MRFTPAALLLSGATVAAIALPAEAGAKTISAACGPFTGYTVGTSGSSDRFTPLSYPDTMNGPFTFTWDTKEQAATIVGPGSNPIKEEAVIVMGDPDQISAVVVYPVSVLVYSLFIKRKLMLVSKHTHSRGMDFDAARGFVMKGDCSRVSVQ